MLDKDGYIKYANPAASELTGHAAQELVHKHCSIFYPSGDDVIKAEYELNQALKKGRVSFEGWKIKKDKTLFWSEITLSAIYDEHKDHIGFSCTLSDFSEKKIRELEYKRSEERYRLMVASVRDYAIFMLDVNGYISTWNEGARRTKGYLADEIIGKHFSTFYTEEDLKTGKPARELKIATATGKYEEEGWRVRKDGSLFWANVVITALFNEENQLIGFGKVTRDLSERKATEEALRQSEERYRLLVEQVTDYGIFMMDEKGRIASWNEGARRINGYSADEIIGKYFSIFYPEEDIISGKPEHELKVARAEGKYEEEGWRLKKNRDRFWASIVITAVYNDAGILIGFSKVTRDLTERKKAERELRESYDKYRLLASELRVANDELSAANEELEQFTSIVSHDLQEPIRTIKSFLQLIDIKLNEEQSSELKLYIGKAIRSANRMRELIQNLLHYSQLSKVDIVKKEVNINDMFHEALQNLKSSLDASNAEIIIENDMTTIMGDRIQLVQLFQNLLSNALKFTDSIHPQIKIKCTREGDHVKFSVSDNGIGIAEGDLNKIFEIFRRLNTKKDYPGTGIGLAICKKIVDRHQGRIWPESQPGKGTTFYFTLNEETEKQTA